MKRILGWLMGIRTVQHIRGEYAVVRVPFWLADKPEQMQKVADRLTAEAGLLGKPVKVEYAGRLIKVTREPVGGLDGNA